MELFKFKIDKELTNKIYQLIEIAKNTGKIKKGTNEITKEIERGNAKLVVVAEDINPIEIVMHIPPLCEEKEILCVPVPSKEDLGAAVGLHVSTSSVAIINEGDGKGLMKEILEAVKKLKN